MRTTTIDYQSSLFSPAKEQNQSKSWVVSTLAGNDIQGSVNGFGTAAQFNHPSGVAVNASGIVYVADRLNHRIRKITSEESVITLAGSTEGFANGHGTAAQFHYPTGVAVDSFGNVYVADMWNNRIRKITPGGYRYRWLEGMVSTLAGGTRGSDDGPGTAAQFNCPFGVAVFGTGDDRRIYVADSLNHRIRKITPKGIVSTFAGSGTAGHHDAIDTEAQFYEPSGVAVDLDGNVYVADTRNHRIRKITPKGLVTTIAGSSQGDNKKDEDAGETVIGIAAQFNHPTGVAVDSLGNLYVADTDNNLIRKITSARVVTTIAGSTSGYNDATGAEARVHAPFGVAVDSSGNVYVANAGNHRIRKIEYK